MTSKKHAAYVAFLETVKSALALAPPTAMTDFEASLQKALAHVFPDTQLIGCLFHYTQAIYRRVCKNNMRAPYLRPCSQMLM